VLVEDLEDVLADLGELGLDLLPVGLDHGDLGLVALRLLLLLDGGDDAPRRTASADDVLVSDREEVALLNGELLVGRGDGLHVLDHLLVALSLLGKLGEVDGVFARSRHLFGGKGMAGRGKVGEVKGWVNGRTIDCRDESDAICLVVCSGCTGLESDGLRM
jgi:hypothetical protein